MLHPESEEFKDCDVAIIGGGPAGSTTACRLAEHGLNVVLFEREHFPRFHIGESLLPANVRLLEELGVRDQVDTISIRKNGVELVSPGSKPSAMLRFADCWDKEMPFSFHVRRSQFDHVLLNRAKALGTTINEGWGVTDVQLGENNALEPALLTAQSVANPEQKQRWRARFIVDASGRDTMLSSRLKLKHRNPRHSSAAMYAHYTGAERLPGDAEGNISIFWFEHGWMWFIPLADGSTSVGAVCWPRYLKTRVGDLAEFFDQTIALAPKLAKRLSAATRINEVTATGNYSYSSTRSSGRNYLLTGDAYAFVDPVFSSGVYLAMNSAFKAAETVSTCLAQPAKAPAALRKFDQTMRKGPREFSWFIYRITKPTFWDLLSTPRNPLKVRDAVLSVLAGDIFGRTPIWPSLYLFKAIYLVSCLGNLPRSLREFRQRRVNISPEIVKTNQA